MTTSFNSFQEQLELYFGGSTGSTLGPTVVNSSLENTTSQRFDIGYQPAGDLRGVDIGATPGIANTAFIDLNSLDNGTNDYDTRVLSIGGEAGVDGRGILALQGNEFAFVGNTVNATPIVYFNGQNTFAGSTAQFYPSVNQGRMFPVQQVIWTGQAGTAPVDPVVEIQFRDRVSLTAFTGHFIITISNGWDGSGTGASVYQAVKSVVKQSLLPPAPGGAYWNGANEEEGDDLTQVYANFDITNSDYPILRIYNKSTDPIRFLISGVVTTTTII